ncbi:hypothetical protein CYYG_00017 [Cyanophage SS120-1]|uniref:Uncharacterized protein n=1 Tax=Cyanophage SS120-1 TaxID=616674 RepID=M1TVR9_9CAUD|nr:hypothetical protein CYYG_00017 [Cyanophage SS120-1]AGG54519.1 hypothetical protein CYYG_00017 [Cyanophage SS120-1]
MASSKTSKFYKKNPKSAAKRRAYDRAYKKREKGSLASGAKKKRLKRADSKRWAERKRRGIAGKGGKDISHTKSGRTVLESRSKNRARNGKNKKSTKK